CHCPDTHVAAFYSNPSIQQPKVYDEAVATANARLSAMLQYMMCVSRFAHYLKVLARDKVGSFIHAGDCQDFLQRWLPDYVQSTGKEAAQAQYPLREARVEIRDHPGKPGCYLGVFHLRPHFQLDQVTTAVKLTTELAPVQPR